MPEKLKWYSGKIEKNFLASLKILKVLSFFASFGEGVLSNNCKFVLEKLVGKFKLSNVGLLKYSLANNFFF